MGCLKFLLGLFFIVLGFFTGGLLIIFWPVGLMIIISDFSDRFKEGQKENREKEQLEELKNLRKDLKEKKEWNSIQKQSEEIERLKKEVEELKKKLKQKSK
ncbi:MAG: hypothetical protein KAU95_00125 [Candidatus Aenigmarchaeota archaeon]|nr:hypothetical protein [Candidatus Aenigmarchaeota archaeon]